MCSWIVFEIGFKEKRKKNRETKGNDLGLGFYDEFWLINAV